MEQRRPLFLLVRGSRIFAEVAAWNSGVAYFSWCEARAICEGRRVANGACCFLLHDLLYIVASGRGGPLSSYRVPC